ncbi:MAG TPA: hypothetical protein DCR27_00475 [Lachnospiraceae bacterium]|nr:hypothetical protein [Lachnospiraceae bacterium]
MDNQSIQTLKSLMNEVLDDKFSGFKTELIGTMDEKLEHLENRMIDTMDVKIRDSENLLLEEMERTRTILENKIDKIQKNVDNLNQYYQIAKLENDNLRLVIESVQNLTKRVEVLEGKSA